MKRTVIVLFLFFFGVTVSAQDEKGSNVKEANISFVSRYAVFDIATQSVWELPESHYPKRFSPDGSKMLSTDLKTIILWNVLTQTPMKRIDLKTELVSERKNDTDSNNLAPKSEEIAVEQTLDADRIEFSPDSKRFVLHGKPDRQARIYSAETGLPIAEHVDTDIWFIPGSDDILGAGFHDGVFRLDHSGIPPNDKKWCNWQEAIKWLYPVAVSKSGDTVLTLHRWRSKLANDYPGKVALFSTKDGSKRWEYTGYKAWFDKEQKHVVVLQGILGITLLPQKSQLKAIILDVESGNELLEITTQEAFVSKDGSALVVMEKDTFKIFHWTVYDIATQEKVAEVSGKVVFSNTGKYYVKESSFGKTKGTVYETRTGKKIGRTAMVARGDRIFSADDRFWVNDVDEKGKPIGEQLIETATNRTVFRMPADTKHSSLDLIHPWEFNAFADKMGGDGKLILRSIDR